MNGFVEKEVYPTFALPKLKVHNADNTAVST